MILQWPYVRRALAATQPSVITEVGAAKGVNTAEVAGFAAEVGAIHHCIDPKPGFDVEEFGARWPGTFVFHRGLSLDILPGLPAADAVLLDGDHNWYTVINELRSLAQSAAREGAPFPLTILHDVDWPYGRRDMYYDPETVPAEFRQPYVVGGVAVGRAEPRPNRDFNSGIYHAEQEGTPRNGVLTASEDFVAESSLPLRLQVIPGFNGLGIVSDERMLERRPALAEVVTKVFPSGEFYAEHCARLVHEMDRYKTAVSNARRTKATLTARNAKLERELAELRARTSGREQHLET